MRARRKQGYIAHQVYLGPRGLEIDGVHLPWHITPDVEVINDWDGFVFGLQVTFYGDRIIVNSPNGEHPDRDTLREEIRAEAVAIVREGLADIIDQIDDD